MIFGAILAGGTGTRMDLENLPKQFLPLGEKPILIHTLEKFCLCTQLDAIYVGAHGDWVNHTQDLIENHGLSGYDIHVVAGGDSRNQTIINILEAIEADHGASDEHIVVTHDSVRPFVKLSIIEANIAAAKAHPACDTVIPATDTIVRSDETGEFISEIPTRDRMYQGQTPQSFKISLFKQIYSDMDEQTRSVLTDACKVFVEAGYPVHLVAGDVTNIKLTTIMDYKIAQAMIESRVIDQ